MKKRGRLWVVREGEGETVAEVLARACEDVSAIREGRVFVGRKRVASGGESVRPGDAITIGVPAPFVDVPILFERDELVAVVKPAGIPSVPDDRGITHALVARVATVLDRDVASLRVTSRLDRDVSGVVLFALSARAEQRLVRARDEGRYSRRYVAIAMGDLDGRGEWTAPIGDGPDPRHRSAFGPSAKPARTLWRVVARAGPFALVAVVPMTGRTHQIRVHASHAGAALFGDRDYGGISRTTLENGRVVALSRIALHCARVTLPARRGAILTAEAKVPDDLASTWTLLGGSPEAWDRAYACEVEE